MPAEARLLPAGFILRNFGNGPVIEISQIDASHLLSEILCLKAEMPFVLVRFSADRSRKAIKVGPDFRGNTHRLLCLTVVVTDLRKFPVKFKSYQHIANFVQNLSSSTNSVSTSCSVCRYCLILSISSSGSSASQSSSI